MTARPQIRIAAELEGGELAGARAGARFLAEAMRRAAPESAPSIDLAPAPPGFEPGRGQRVDICLVSTRPELSRPPEPRRETLARWTSRIRALQAHVPHVFVCTVFRHVAGRARGGPPDARLARIRMLNLMAADLSQALDVMVIDIDLAMAGFGARALGADCALGGPGATVVVGHAIANAILAASLDDLFDDSLLEGARDALGGTLAVSRAIAQLPPPAATVAAAGHG